MTDEAMVERVARALYEHDQRMTPDEIGGKEKWSEFFAWDGPHFKGQNIYRAQARAAMLEAGADRIDRLLSELKRLHEICGHQSTADLIAEIEGQR